MKEEIGDEDDGDDRCDKEGRNDKRDDRSGVVFDESEVESVGVAMYFQQPLLTPAQLRRLERHKYSAQSSSLLDGSMQRW